jgi:hypothetical protein
MLPFYLAERKRDEEGGLRFFLEFAGRLEAVID